MDLCALFVGRDAIYLVGAGNLGPYHLLEKCHPVGEKIVAVAMQAPPTSTSCSHPAAPVLLVQPEARSNGRQPRAAVMRWRWLRLVSAELEEAASTLQQR